jgi:hypothetical protein
MKKDYKIAVANLYELLKPGGYIQWSEFDMIKLSYDDSFTGAKAVIELINKYIASVGMSVTSTVEIQAALKEIGISEIVRRDYTQAKHPELKADLQSWANSGGNALLKPSILHLGMAVDAEEAQGIVDRMLSARDEEHAQGATPILPLFVTVAQRI